MDITLYYTPQTRAVRPRWLLEELGVPYLLEYVDLYAVSSGSEAHDKYMNINHLCRVPALKIDGEVMVESGAICQWLADHFYQAGFAPRAGSMQRRQYDQWMYYIAATFEPPLWEIMLNRRILPQKNRNETILDINIKRYKKYVAMISSELQNKPFMCESGFSVVDIMLMPMLLYDTDLYEDHDVIVDYVERLQQREAWQRASAD